MYFWMIVSFFGVGVLLGILMRLELIAPGGAIMNAKWYNATFTVHGVIMIFLVIIPSIPASFGNFMLLLQIGARDVFIPKLNLLSWYCYVTGAILVVTSLFTGGGAPDTGWTFYVPYSVETSTNVTLGLTGVFIIGMSSILTGLNFITTIHRLRAPGMTFFRMPLFIWALYGTSWIQVIATPILAITLMLVILERVFGLPIFDARLGGDPLLYQHLFWIYSHPAVYIFIAACYYWFPKIFGRMYREKTAVVGAVIFFIGFNLLYFTMFILGYEGMPRRYFDFPHKTVFSQSG